MSATRPGRMLGIEWRRLSAVGSVRKASGSLFLIRRSFAATLLAMIAITGMLLLGAGCNTWGAGDRSASSIRPSASETSRLTSNARYYKLMGRPEAALKEMEAAHRADPDNLKIVDLLAQNYQELGHFQQAQDLFREALERRGHHQALENNLCFSFYLQGNLTKAEACFKEALERDPGNIAARNNLGLVWCRQGKLAEAKRLWEAAEGVAGAQDHMNQALALLGKAPADYAKLPQAKPQPQAAMTPKPAASVHVASAAKPAATPTPAPVAAAPPKAEVKVAAQPAAPKPVTQPQQAAALKPAPKVNVVAAAKPEPAKAPTPAPVTLTPAKAIPQMASQPVEPKPAPQPQAAPASKAAAPVQVASMAKTAATPTPAPVAAAPPKAEVKVAAQPAAPKPVTQPQQAAALKPTPKVNVAAAAKLEPAKAQPPAPAVVAPAKAEPQVSQPAVPLPVLTAQEREQSGIEVRNGTWTKNLAHDTRSLLTREGFKVAVIGNHIDFGVESTVIYYRPGAEKVARVLTAEIFPGAKSEPNSSLTNGVAVKVLLGRDWLDQPQTMARLSGDEPVVSHSAAQVKLLAGKETAVPAKPERLKPQIQALTPAPTMTALAAPKVAPPAPVAAATSMRSPTAAELMATAIEIRNGTRTPDLARQTRSMLSLEGYTVGMIGNHIDFGAEYTVIYYRPEAERVARALNSKIFPNARLTPDSRINHGMAIKIVLGRDLLDRPRLMSCLATQ